MKTPCLDECENGGAMKLHSKIILILLAVLGVSLAWTIVSDYESSKQQVRDDLRNEADNIRGVLMATRRVYHHQFLDSGLPLNNKTLGFLPAHALSRISEDFKNWTDSGMEFNNVSDRPRNSANQADAIEMEAMRFYRDNPQVEERFVQYDTDEGDSYYHYSRPIWTEEYCLKCHGKRADAPDTIQAGYDTAFGYEVGDLRGIMSIKLPGSVVQGRSLATAKRNLWSHFVTLAIAFLLIYWLVIQFAVRKLRKLEASARKVADGDYSCATGITGRDEIGKVAMVFDTMVDRLADREKRMTDALELEKLATKNLETAVAELDLARQIAESATRSKSEFLANMSHEIRTPMTAILGFSELMMGRTSDEQDVAALQTINRNGEHLLEIINDILDLSKIESGHLQIERVDCSPHQILSDVDELMQVRASNKNIRLSIGCSGPLPERIETDPTRLKQILINLIGNAIKFTNAGQVDVVARTVDAATSNPTLQIEVTDTGIGISPQQLHVLFQPFSQADTSTTREFGGTGLGLTISKRLAESLGGGIGVRSEPGRGSTFTLSVSTGPLGDVQMIDSPLPYLCKPTRAAVEDSEPTALDGCRVLLAEDGVDNQRLISVVLSRAGAVVTVANNGAEAVELAMVENSGDAPFDVILMDIQMPVMDGYDATAKLRSLHCDTPIIALTAHAMMGDREKCIDAGCDDYTTKPIDRGQLISLVHKYGAKQMS